MYAIELILELRKRLSLPNHTLFTNGFVNSGLESPPSEAGDFSVKALSSVQLYKICVSVYHSKASNELHLLHVPGTGSRNPCEMSADTSLQAMMHWMG